MGNALTPNLVLINSGEYFNAAWKLTRTMLAAGWKYFASGNGQSGGVVQANQSGSAATLSAPASNLQTLSAMSPANITAACVGQKITITAAGGTGNVGTFLITSFVSSSSVTIYNPSGSATTGTVTWNFIRDPALDLWGVDGAVNLRNVPSGGSGSGTGVFIGAATASTGQATITGVSGFSQNLSPGRYLTITGSTTYVANGILNYSNNGSFRIVSVNAAGTSVTVYAPHLLAETTSSSLAVVEQYSGADGTIGTYSTVTTGQSYLLNFTTSSFNSFTSADVGRRITILNAASAGNQSTFTIATVVSSNNVLLYSPNGVASDTPSGTIQWVETDPLQQSYPSYLQSANGQGAWIVLQGPAILKIPIGSNSVTGTFIRGENLTQSTTGAQGELLGVITDTTGGTGYLVVAPRVGGTGVQASSTATWGWNNSANTDTISGSISGATVTTPANSTPIAYVHELVFWKNTAAQGHIYYQCVDQNTATESAVSFSTGRFSQMANTLTTVTAQLCPGSVAGNNPTTNGFPTVGTLCMLGTGGSGAASTGAAQWPVAHTTALTSPGKAHLICANNIEQQGVSPDGSWTYMQSTASSGYSCLTMQRCDNQEDGDLDPYVTSAFSGGYGYNSGGTSPSRTVNSNNSSGWSATDNMNSGLGWWNDGRYAEVFRGFRRRGLPNETFTTFVGCLLWAQSYSVGIIWTNNGYPDEIATAVQVTNLREPVWLAAGCTNSGGVVNPRMRKGTPRWFMITCAVPANSTLDGQKWISASPTTAMFVFGPWDGATVPNF
jgi:hypothetical protein